MKLFDRDIREPLFDFLEEKYPVNRIIEEKRMGGSRADLVMITPESIFGIEIKSDADNYQRLSGQVEDYDRYFDYNIIVVGSTHAAHVREHVPGHWGIITVERMPDEQKTDFYLLREPEKNPNFSWERKMSMLWRPEMAHIQEINGMFAYRQKSKLFVLRKILETVPQEVLQIQICRELMERDYNTIGERIYAYRKKNARPGKTVRRKNNKKKYKVIGE